MQKVTRYAAVMIGAVTVAPATAPIRTSIPYTDAKPILDSLREDLLPAALRALTGDEREAAWPGWVSRRDVEIRARVAQGEEDSVANLILFGTTYTTRSRATQREIAARGGPSSPDAARLIRERIDDLAVAVATPGPNERLRFVRQILERNGIHPTTAEGREQARRYFVRIMTRVAAESDAFDRATEPSALFRDRGLSSDASIFPNFAIHEALEAISKGMTRARIRRVAVVGPGLDLIDKGSGFDFYPVQTIQPFAVVDSLVRLGLAAGNEVAVTTFDLNPRVTEHLEETRQRARTGGPYTLHLARDRDERWSAPLLRYWQEFGGAIAEEGKAVDVPPATGNIQVRAVCVRPAVVMSVLPQDVNIVLQRLETDSADEQFDLVIATNVLIYYDVFEQSLALVNLAKMLRPGGILLSNDRLVELPSIPLSRAGHLDVVYTGQNGSRVTWYRRL